MEQKGSISMNCLIVSGHVTGNVEERTTKNNDTFVTFNIAWNKKGKDGNDKTIFFQVSAFGKNAEFAKKFLKKGSSVEVAGELDSSIGEKGDKHFLNNRILANSIGFYGFPMKKDAPAE